MEKIIISVDLGLTGFVSILQCNKDHMFLIDFFKISTEEKGNELTTKKSNYSIKNQVDFISNNLKIKELKDEYQNVEFIMLFEQVSTRTGFTAASAMSLSDTQAVFRCIANLNNIEYFQISPSKWKKKLNISKDKKESLELFNNLIEERKIQTLCKVLKNHNFIESILIAYYYFKVFQ